MAGNDKAMHAFMRGALTIGNACVVFYLALCGLIWIVDGSVSPIPNKTEDVFWIALLLLGGGVIGLFKHFAKERRIQFSIRLLLLITLLVSFSGAWGTLKRTRQRVELQAFDVFEASEVRVFGSRTVFSSVTELMLDIESADSDTIPFLISQLRFFSGLHKIHFSEGSVSKADLTTLRAAFPDVEFVIFGSE